jgi:hypothetical protein
MLSARACSGVRDVRCGREWVGPAAVKASLWLGSGCGRSPVGGVVVGGVVVGGVVVGWVRGSCRLRCEGGIVVGFDGWAGPPGVLGALVEGALVEGAIVAGEASLRGAGMAGLPTVGPGVWGLATLGLEVLGAVT